MATPARVALPTPISDDPVGASVLAHQPEALAAFNKLYGILWSHGVLDRATKEVARIRNARTVNCPICKAIRFEGAVEDGLDEAQVDRIADGYESSTLSERHKAVIRTVDVFLSRPGELPAELRGELERHFTPAQIVELMAGIALFMGFSKIAVALGGLPDEIPVHAQPTPDWSAPG